MLVVLLWEAGAGSAQARQEPAETDERADEPAGARVEAADERVAKMLDATLNGSPVVRPQAAERLATMGAAGAAAVLAHLGDGLDELARSGPELTGVLAQFDSEPLRERAWEAAFDPRFPWKTAAVRSLGLAPRATEAERFVRMTSSPLASVRAEATAALAGLRLPAMAPRLKYLLADPDGAVRRRAALGLDAVGEAGALQVVWKDLEREEVWFEVDTGQPARRDAERLLRRIVPDALGGYDVRAPHGSAASSAALFAVHRALTERDAGRPEDPVELPRAYMADASKLRRVLSGVDGEDLYEVLGPRSGVALELLSCRTGDLRLAWASNDVLWVGEAPAAFVRLIPGTTERLANALARALDELAPPVEEPDPAGADSAPRRPQSLSFGDPGCDRETFTLAPAGVPARRALVLRDWDVELGPRPPELDALALELLAALPDDERPDDARLDRLRTRARVILESVGGSLEAEADGEGLEPEPQPQPGGSGG